ncbi:MAG TPA: YfiR family protein [Methylibium sp.]|nr:YfiR family protein [Methylibium sp.]
MAWNPWVWLRRLRPVAGALALALAAPAWAADEADLKAAIVFNLLMFADWPAAAQPAPGAPWVLCIPPAHPAAAAFKPLQGRPLRGARLALQAWPVAAGAPPCHAAFVGDAETGEGEPRPTPGLLLISDAQLPPRAAAIVLQPRDSKLVFSVNLGAARRAELQLSAKLLRLAQGVQE